MPPLDHWRCLGQTARQRRIDLYVALIAAGLAVVDVAMVRGAGYQIFEPMPGQVQHDGWALVIAGIFVWLAVSITLSWDDLADAMPEDAGPVPAITAGERLGGRTSFGTAWRSRSLVS